MSYRADRYWWAYVMGAIIASSFGASLLAWSLDPLTPTTGYLLTYALVGEFFAGLAFLLAFGLAVLGFGGWRRTQHRHQSFDGNASGMPDSTIEPDMSDVFDISREPLVLVWRAQYPTQALRALPVLYTRLIRGATTGVLFAWLTLVAPTAFLYQWFPAFASSPLAEWLFGGSDFPKGLSLLPAMWALPDVFGPIMNSVISRVIGAQLTIVEAIGKGIRFQPLIGRVHLMRWHDMRLLEVEERRGIQGDSDSVTRSYTLFGRSQTISWVEWGPKEKDLPQPEGITWDEMWALSRELVDVIYQRTGLTPRTFTKSLQHGSANAPSSLPPEEEWMPAEVNHDAHA